MNILHFSLAMFHPLFNFQQGRKGSQIDYFLADGAVGIKAVKQKSYSDLS